jgi:hypothetical protein
MKLKIHKELEYFSPTSFLQACGCELEFYLLRLSGIPITRMPQNEQMAVGCAFDAFVKSRISELLGKEVFLAKLLETVEPQNAHLIPIAHDIFDTYESYGCVKMLLDQGIADIELEYKERIGGLEVPGSKSILGGVTLFGKPDAELQGGVPLDWKTSGYNFEGSKSPPAGYTRYIKKGYNQGAHPEKKNMEQVDMKWATQLAMYKWLRSGLTLHSFSSVIDLILIQGTEISVANYSLPIGDKFLVELWAKVLDTWSRFQEGSFIEPSPSSTLCEPYRQPKVCTCFCPLYKQFMTDPVHGFIRGNK